MSKHSTPSVNLFPFLAVLVCTMGALILLLLVTTRRIRQQAALPPPSPVIVEAEVQAEAIPVIDPDTIPIEPWLAFNPPPVEVEEPAIDWQAIRAKERAEYEAKVHERRLQQQAINEEWSARLAEATQRKQLLESQLKTAQSNISGSLENSKTARKELDQLTKVLAQAMTEKAAILNEMEQLELVQVQQESQYIGLQEELSHLELKPVEKEIEFEIVGFGGNSKTRRRPILIECREDGISFAVEGITLTPQQLSGFTQIHNPLKAGGEALVDYWTRTENLEVTKTKPYVLLLVRPGGSIAFYIARQLFEAMDEEFGYELIPHNDPLRWAQADPQAVAVCQAAIDAVLNQRSRLASRLRSGDLPVADALQFAGADGKFRLQEVDHIRDAGDDFGMGMQAWKPPHRGPSGSQSQYNSKDDSGFSNGSQPEGTLGSNYRNQPSRGLENGDFTQNPLTRSSNGLDALSSPNLADEQLLESLQSGNSLNRLEQLLEQERLAQSEGKWKSAADQSGDSLEVSSSEQIEQQLSLSGSEHQHSNGTENSPRSGVRELPRPQANATKSQNSPSSDSRQSSPSNSYSRPTFEDRVANAKGQTIETTSPGGGGHSMSANGGLQSQTHGQSNLGQATSSRVTRPPTIEDLVPRDPLASIGIEREVTIHIYKDRVQIDELKPLMFSTALTPDELRAQYQHYLISHFDSWDPAPQSFFWRAYLHYQIHPGGNVPYARLKPITDSLKAKTKTDYVLD